MINQLPYFASPNTESPPLLTVLPVLQQTLHELRFSIVSKVPLPLMINFEQKFNFNTFIF